MLTKADIPDSNRKYEILMDQLDNWDAMMKKLEPELGQVPSSKPRFESVHFISPRLELRNRKRDVVTFYELQNKNNARKVISLERDDSPTRSIKFINQVKNRP